ncbi:TRAP transporter permease [Effusibacillus lacus]|uniref:C4-dicarboxylate ABC transporter n=1 Tax=Effusibacillus lacus TaxID=1348429 RepID=A0A292YR49_9BACL|nr:TRAP transporter permease [Effusibacillus lacus]TCS76902.1 TRAP transporter 4TM/12TM fusion protein [Effusibacillus lacus]GAX91233.1 C4-dicarboxylate ABC transporter [Effusibacillus lacus]
MAEQKDPETMNQAEIQKLISEYDRESSFREVSGAVRWFVTLFAIAFTLYQLSISTFLLVPDQIARAVHLAFGLGLIFLLFPFRKVTSRHSIPIWDWILALLGVGVGLYWLIEYEGLVQRVGDYTNTDFIIGGLTILLVMEAARRVVGWPIVIIAGTFLLYALYGKYLPGFFTYRGVTIERLISHMYYTTEGILGVPLGVSASFIFLFILFGAFLEKTGVGDYFNDLALAIAGKRIGGPAKVTVFSSALQGTISGSSVANVVQSGAFTIPLMKRLGYRSEFAAGVEASSSTGGQIMPPIMGAAAFLMAEFIGVPYWDIAKAAAIPAILFFAGIWMMVHFEARKTGLRGLTEEEMPNRKEVFKKIYLLLPIVVIIVASSVGVTPIRSALYGIVSTVFVGAFRKETRMSLKDILIAFENGAKAALGVVAATACAGIIVGVVTLTGLGLKFANGLLDLAGGLIIPTLILTMIASLILGMGVPTTANYIITSTIAAPAIIALGYPALSAHMFTFYFGIVADITPPVALAAFAASGIARSKPIRTGVESTRLSISAFIIPYIFVFAPEILLVDTTFGEATWMFVKAFIGMLGVSAGLIGFWLRRMPGWERIITVAAGLLLIVPGLLTDIIGLGTLALVLLVQYLQTRNKEAGINN